MNTCASFLCQSEPITVEANPDGSIDVPIKADGTHVKIIFNPTSLSETISVGPIEVKACSEPSKYLLFDMIALAYSHTSVTK